MLRRIMWQLNIFASTAAAETILGVYIFHRHGDRTPKSLAPTNLTTLGYNQAYNAGTYFRGRYVDGDSATYIPGLNDEDVKLSQFSVTAPVDNVLENSALAFTQALYPARGRAAASQVLRNGSAVEAPLDGYQLIPIREANSGRGSEDSGWLQDVSDCGNAEVSSNEYFFSYDYQKTFDDSKDFYRNVKPVVSSFFNDSQISYKNAYTIFDYINVASIHNRTIPSLDLMIPSALNRLQSLAATHELNLAYNVTSPVRAIAGAQLAAQAVDFLNKSITTSTESAPRLGIHFGAYASFQSYFGLAGLLDVPGADGTGVNFRGIPDYASAMVWEVFTTSISPGRANVDEDELSIRFLYRNSSTGGQVQAYPLFGLNRTSIPWRQFVDETAKFSVGSTRDWCVACGNSTGLCAEFADEVQGQGANLSERAGGRGMSNVIAGVIGVVVTLAFVLGVGGVFLLLGGLRLVKRRRSQVEGVEKAEVIWG